MNLSDKEAYQQWGGRGWLEALGRYRSNTLLPLYTRMIRTVLEKETASWNQGNGYIVVEGFLRVL